MSAIRAAVAAGELAVDAPDTVVVERPKNRDHGDYATNVALQLAKPAGRPPREVAEIIAARLREATGDRRGRHRRAGLPQHHARPTPRRASSPARSWPQGAEYGRSDVLAKERINLEFVSANPTGPVHLGHTRWAALGDALGRVLDAAGADVTREYYFNDAGVQIDRFARVAAAPRARRAGPRGRATPASTSTTIAAQVVADASGRRSTLPDDEALAIFAPRASR